MAWRRRLPAGLSVPRQDVRRQDPPHQVDLPRSARFAVHLLDHPAHVVLPPARDCSDLAHLPALGQSHQAAHPRVVAVVMCEVFARQVIPALATVEIAREVDALAAAGTFADNLATATHAAGLFDQGARRRPLRVVEHGPVQRRKDADGPLGVSRRYEFWLKVRDQAGIVADARLHDLRHSFAFRALVLGESLPMIGKLLGHTQVQTTARYAHLANESVKASGSRIGDSVGAYIAPSEPA